jgi:hypothetical protein
VQPIPATSAEALEKPWECKLPVGSNPTPSALVVSRDIPDGCLKTSWTLVASGMAGRRLLGRYGTQPRSSPSSVSTRTSRSATSSSTRPERRRAGLWKNYRYTSCPPSAGALLLDTRYRFPCRGYDRHVRNRRDRPVQAATTEDKEQDKRDCAPSDVGKLGSGGKPTGEEQAAINRELDPPA